MGFGSGGDGDSGVGSGPIGDDVTVTISGRRILVNGEPLHIRGVCWNPVPRGGVHPDDLDFSAFASTDIPLMRAAGINAVRTYEPLTDRAVLDELQQAGIYVLNSVYPWGGAPAMAAVEPVEAVKDHPAVLLWVLGNEWNYNGLYVGMSHEDSLGRLNDVAALVKAADPTRPVATIYGEVPSADTLAAMPDVEVWGLNVYRGIGFGDLFGSWEELSGKPMFLGEYGADAWNALTESYDPAAQAEATAFLTELIVDSSAALADGITSGGTLFEWADEWWKDGDGSPDTHDAGGTAPGGGPHPDAVFNEEWWGIVDIERNPRPAYDALREIYTGLGPTPGTKP